MNINISDAALKKFAEFSAADADGCRNIRIAIQGGGCAGFQHNLSLIGDSNIDEDDFTFDRDGLKFVVDSLSAAYLENVSIDYLETLTNSGFKFVGGSITRNCGCGRSFSA